MGFVAKNFELEDDHEVKELETIVVLNIRSDINVGGKSFKRDKTWFKLSQEPDETYYQHNGFKSGANEWGWEEKKLFSKSIITISAERGLIQVPVAKPEGCAKRVKYKDIILQNNVQTIQNTKYLSVKRIRAREKISYSIKTMSIGHWRREIWRINGNHKERIVRIKWNGWFITKLDSIFNAKYDNNVNKTFKMNPGKSIFYGKTSFYVFADDIS